MSDPSQPAGLVTRLTVAELAQLANGRAHTVRSDALVRPVLTADHRTVGAGEVLVILPGTPWEEALAAGVLAGGRGVGAVLLEGTEPIPGVPTVTVAHMRWALWHTAAWVAARHAPSGPAGAVVLGTGGRGVSTALQVCGRLHDGEDCTLHSTDPDTAADLALPMALTRVADRGAQVALYEAPGDRLSALRASAALTRPDVLVALPLTGPLPAGATRPRIAGEILAVAREMTQDQTVVLCTDDADLRRLAGRIHGPQVMTVSTTDPTATVHATGFRRDQAYTATIAWRGHRSVAALPVRGRTVAVSALAGFAAFLAARGLTVPAIADGLDGDDYQDLLALLSLADPSGPGRMQRKSLPGCGGLLLDDTGTCSLPDMLAAAEALPLYARPSQELAAIVGELDTGADENTVKAHTRAGKALAAAGVRHLAVVTGTLPTADDTGAKALLTAAADHGVDHTELLTDTGPHLDRFAEALPAGSAVLVKGLGLGPVLPYLAAHFTARVAKP
ncbi:hypothetical protein [Kitasatospora griseola]|uniref:hypothetical protein n=1 Tax=Kitasatospora griseola TaxID=2064 RepID=UPI00343F9824